MDERTLRARARRAYELARLRRALLGGLAAAPAVGLGFLSSPALGLGLGGGLYALCVALLWWGREPGRAVAPGVAGGTLCAGVLLFGACSPADGVSACVLISTAGGLLAGGVVGWRAGTLSGHGRRSYLGAGLLVAALAGSAGCALAGVIGVAGMSMGLLAAGGGAVLLTPRGAST